ncbi:MAG: DEAD/DEAH box helicase [Candidatus Blackburnbacteria bacterium]|nr:DEAD/DEAH box helicase [Candidatus Blackburnbacteria bacterium]
MSNSSPPLQTKLLQRAKNSDEFNLYVAGIEWDLIEPIVIEDRDDMHSEKKWSELLEPYYHQVTNLITFCRRLPVTLLADDVGLGKTISAGLVTSELMARGRVTKILIVCPKLLMFQWKEELETKFGISSVIATGRDLIKATPPGELGAVITTYDSARLHLDKISDVGYEMLILDEAHKLRNLYGIDPPPKRAVRFKQALEDRLFKYVLMLTATPIQNRLWDIYSLVDLLTTARGHENPFGNPGIFARRFIADARTKARQLVPSMKDEFRSIVYGYMSRVRRADANLYFPERTVQLHKVTPTPDELKLIDIIAEPIQKLNRLAQISILQALTSSPHALSAQLKNMARNGTIPESLSLEVSAVVENMNGSAKLKGLSTLIDKLETERPNDWRLVIFTGRRETQTTIEEFLGKRGITCGLINGDSGLRNQETITQFKQKPPDIHVIVSTEAGAEGINLQAANVLANYDLPWNPMIVEQRVGRIQRLASEHAKVSIFNIILSNTFEEYIVARLMEKLQMASQAIGDVEAMLEASGLDEDENGSVGFEEMVRRLVIDSLAGKDVEVATKIASESITKAKTKLKEEQKNISSMLGTMGDASEFGPRCPSLPKLNHSMDIRDFVLTAQEGFGAKITPQSKGIYFCELNDEKESIYFEEKDNGRIDGVLYAQGTSAFERLVSKVISKRLHDVEDLDKDLELNTQETIRGWVSSFNGAFKETETNKVWNCFEGTALIRVRSTVAHDSYERLVSIECLSKDHKIEVRPKNLKPLGEFIDGHLGVGVVPDQLVEKAMLDEGIDEFCRFYKERMVQEVVAAGSDLRKKKKLEDEFTPRVEMSLVGLVGTMHRQLQVDVAYDIDSIAEYKSSILVLPFKKEVIEAPVLYKCESTGEEAPHDCLGICDISGRRVLRHLLVSSEESGRKALPEYIRTCALSGKKVLSDEIEKSAITGESVTSSLLKTSALSGKRAELKFFGTCEFTSAEVLEDELAISQISGKKYRMDEQLQSVVSKKTGHKQEFIFCAETGQPLLSTETETCELTKKVVIPGLLETCEVSKKKVLPAKLEKSALSGKKALKKYFVSSSISDARLLEGEAIRSVDGNFCSPLEAKRCSWSDRECHSDDLKICNLTGLPIYLEYVTRKKPSRLEPLVDLLGNIRRTADEGETWVAVAEKASTILKMKGCKVESAVLSPDKGKLAVCIEVKTWLGLKVRYAGLVFLIKDEEVIGKISLGRREKGNWLMENS